MKQEVPMLYQSYNIIHLANVHRQFCKVILYHDLACFLGRLGDVTCEHIHTGAHDMPNSQESKIYKFRQYFVLMGSNQTTVPGCCKQGFKLIGTYSLQVFFRTQEYAK